MEQEQIRPSSMTLEVVQTDDSETNDEGSQYGAYWRVEGRANNARCKQLITSPPGA